MRVIIHTIVFSLLLIPYWVNAGDLDSLRNSEDQSLRSAYVHEIKGKLYIKPLFAIKSLSLKLKGDLPGMNDIRYRPNGTNFTGVGFYIFDIGLEFSFRLPQNDGFRFNNGKRSFDFQTNIYKKKWGADIAYQRYNDLYLDDPTLPNGLWSKDNPTARDDLELSYWQMNLFYIVNHQRFSYRSPYLQAEQQLKSQGSFQIGLFASSFQFSADSTLVPENAVITYPQPQNIEAAKITALAVLPGYSYTLTHNKVYLNASIAAGPGNIWTRSLQDDETERKVEIRPVFNFRAAVGYNGDQFFAGVTAYSQSVSGQVDKLTINSTSSHVKFFVGFRFNEVGVLKKRIF